MTDASPLFTRTLPPARELTLVRGRGAHLWDEAGRRYVDLGVSLGVAGLGHGHPAVVRAIHRQVEDLVALGTAVANPIRTRFAQTLSTMGPIPGARVFLCNSGAEAVEAALKFARGATGRSGFVAAAGGFHGRTLGALSVTHRLDHRRPFEPLLADVRFVPFGDGEALEHAVDDGTAAVILEPIQGEGGIHVAPPGYLAQALEACHVKGALLILDEVQTGLGRTGYLWACQAERVAPDILTTSKALGGGLPLGAALVAPAVDDLVRGVHHTTFGGNPLACAAGLATLETLARERPWERAGVLGREALDLLPGVPGVREVRGRGLMIGVDLRTRAAPVVKALQGLGYLPSMAGPTVVRLLPPLVIEAEDWVEGLRALGGTVRGG